MLPAAIAHISGELLSLACFSTMPGGMISGVLEGHRGSQVTTPFSCSATPGCHLSLSPPPSLFFSADRHGAVPGCFPLSPASSRPAFFLDRAAPLQ